MLAASRIHLGHGDAGAAGRRQPASPHHHHAPPRGGPQTHPRRADHRPDQRHHLRQPGPTAEGVISQIVALYENTRLGRQEIYAEFLETSEGVWFANFDQARHVSVEAEYHPGYPVRCAIDAGTSRHTAAVFFQVRAHPGDDRPRITVFGEYHAVDAVSAKNARAIKALADELPCRGRIDAVRLDPAAVARSSSGPAAYGEYERVFGSRVIARWPNHLVLDGLDTIELMLDARHLTIHPRCVRLKEAFGCYCRQRRGSEWVDFPADGHPEEDMMDALRGGIRDALPEGNVVSRGLPRIHASKIF